MSDSVTAIENHTIELVILTEDPERRDIIKRYWKLNPSGQFVEPLSSLKEEFGLNRGGILSIVRTDSRAFSTVHQCRYCGTRKEFTSRQDFRHTPSQRPHVCSECKSQESQLEEDPSPSEDGDEEGGKEESWDGGSDSTSGSLPNQRSEEQLSLEREIEASLLDSSSSSSDGDSNAEKNLREAAVLLRGVASRLHEISRQLRA